MRPGRRFAAFPPPDFRILFESAPGFYLVLARDLTVVAASEAYLDLTGIEREKIIGRKLSTACLNNACNPFAGLSRALTASIQRVLETGAADTIAAEPCVMQKLTQNAGAKERFWTFVNTPISAPDGTMAWILHRAEDVTDMVRIKNTEKEREKLGEELAGLYEKSRELDRLKTSFFANVSYEFRAALESVLASLEDARTQEVGALEGEDLRIVHFNALRLLKLTNSLMDFATAESIPVHSPPAAKNHAERPHILIVDDSRSMRSYLSNLLSSQFRISVAENGNAALAAVRIDRPDLIVSDVSMPLIDGITLVRSLKDDPETSAIPFILHSAGGSNDDCITGVEAGADDYVPKSISARELISRVRTHLELAQAHQARAAAAREMASARLAGSEGGSLEQELLCYRLSLNAPTPPHIAGLTDMLERNFGTVLDAKAKRHLSSLDAKNMNALIDEMLNFSRMNRTEIRKGPIDLRSLVEAVIDKQIEQDPCGPPTEWAFGNLPSIRGDREMLHAVLVHLISNALKFSSRCPERRIEIGASDAEGHVVFYVRDNGSGFDMHDSEHLFGVFERLHSADGFEGAGIGLAIVRHIIQRHGGHVWATGTVGHGATFYCSLPMETEN